MVAALPRIQVDPKAREAVNQAAALDLIVKGKQLFGKAESLRKQGRLEEALQQYQEVLRFYPGSHTTQAQIALLLIDLGRFDDGLGAFRKADQLLAADWSIAATYGEQRLSYLGAFYHGWSIGAINRGLLGILQQDPTMLQESVEEYLTVLEKAREQGLEDWVLKPSPSQLPESCTQEEKDALEEMQLAIRLLAIKDPFEGWRALGSEISKVWPKNVSAVDAIREQRDREWNR